MYMSCVCTCVIHHVTARVKGDLYYNSNILVLHTCVNVTATILDFEKLFSKIIQQLCRSTHMDHKLVFIGNHLYDHIRTHTSAISHTRMVLGCVQVIIIIISYVDLCSFVS